MGSWSFSAMGPQSSQNLPNELRSLISSITSSETSSVYNLLSHGHVVSQHCGPSATRAPSFQTLVFFLKTVHLQISSSISKSSSSSSRSRGLSAAGLQSSRLSALGYQLGLTLKVFRLRVPSKYLGIFGRRSRVSWSCGPSRIRALDLKIEENELVDFRLESRL